MCTYELYLAFFIFLSGCAGGGNADRIQKLRKEYHQARREGLPFYEEDEGRTQLSDYDQHWVGLQCAAKCSCSIRGLQKMSICLYFIEILCQPNMILGGFTELEKSLMPASSTPKENTGNMKTWLKNTMPVHCL